jgi:hypothetical protein
MSTTKTRRPRLGVISVGDALDTPSGIGIVKSVEAVCLSRSWPGNPCSGTERYAMTDGDYRWDCDRRDVVGVVLKGACPVDGNVRDSLAGLE